MRVLYPRVVCLLACLLLAGCAMANEQKPRGTIYVSLGQRLVSVNMATGKSAVLYVNLTEGMDCIVKLDDRRFLFVSLGKTGMTDRARIFNRVTLELSPLLTDQPGGISCPAYLPELHVLVYRSGDGHGLGAIYWSNIHTFDQRHLIQDDVTGMEGGGSSIIAIGADEVLYVTSLDTSGRLHLYNIKTGKRREVYIPDCVPLLWRSESDQLLCSKGDSFNYFLTNLDGSHQQNLPAGHYVPVSYIPQLDAAIISGARPGFRGGLHEVWTTWFYYFKSRSMIEVSNDFGGGHGSVIWYPN